MDRIQTLQIYARVVESGSFSKAAEQLDVHVSVVSKAVKYLENQLGSRLLNRTTRKIALTAEGEQFYEKCVSLLAELENTFNDLSGSAQQAQGKLRVDMSPAVMPFIVRRLPEFQRQYPDIQLVLTASDRISDLIDDGLDCALRLGKLDDAGYIAKRLADVQMVLCAAPSYLAERGTPTGLDDLQQHSAVNFFSGKHRKILPWQFTQNGKPRSIKMPSEILVNDSSLLLNSLIAGLGIGYLPHLLAESPLKTGELTQILPDCTLPSRDLWLVYPQRTFIPKRLAVFMEWVVGVFGEGE